MICRLKEKHIEELNATSILPQTPFWGRIKSEQGFIPKGFELTVSKDLLLDSEESLVKKVDDILVLIRPIDQHNCYAYVPYGPKLEPIFENQGLFLEQLSETIRAQLPPNCIFIRYDLMWQNQWSTEDEYFDASGNWIGPPENPTQELRVNYKTNNWNLKKSAGDLLPKNTFFLDLSLDEEKLLGNMRYNTRYNIKRANQKGISVKEYGLEHISDWYKVYLDTALRHDMPLLNEDFFTTIIKNQDNGSKGVNVKMLMADYKGKYLSAMFLVLSQNRGSYLYGASSNANKDMMASYALQWESIKIAKNWGCTEYDMFGSAPNLKRNHPLHGVHIYKKGFGGNLYHRMGCWDYPYDLQAYNVYRFQEIQN